MYIYKYIGPKYIANIFGPAYKNLALWKLCAPFWWCLWVGAAKAADQEGCQQAAGPHRSTTAQLHPGSQDLMALGSVGGGVQEPRT